MYPFITLTDIVYGQIYVNVNTITSVHRDMDHKSTTVALTCGSAYQVTETPDKIVALIRPAHISE